MCLRPIAGAMRALPALASALAVLLLSGCSGTPSTSDNPEGDQNATVSMVDYKFNPTTRNVHKGSTVTWTNDGGVAHTTTAHNQAGLAWDSGNMDPGKTYSRTFNDVGDFSYHCDYHPAMVGRITVTE